MNRFCIGKSLVQASSTECQKPSFNKNFNFYQTLQKLNFKNGESNGACGVREERVF